MEEFRVRLYGRKVEAVEESPEVGEISDLVSRILGEYEEAVCPRLRAAAGDLRERWGLVPDAGKVVPFGGDS